MLHAQITTPKLMRVGESRYAMPSELKILIKKNPRHARAIHKSVITLKTTEKPNPRRKRTSKANTIFQSQSEMASIFRVHFGVRIGGLEGSAVLDAGESPGDASRLCIIPTPNWRRLYRSL